MNSGLHRTAPILLLAHALSCGPGEITVEAELGECTDRVDDIIQTCEDICAAEDSVCVEAGCDGATYRIGFSVDACTMPEWAVGVAAECAAPIEWQFNTFGRCCCEVR